MEEKAEMWEALEAVRHPRSVSQHTGLRWVFTSRTTARDFQYKSW